MDAMPASRVGPVRPWRTIGAIALTLVLIVTVATASTLAASPTACLAVNVDTGFTAGTLRAVVKAAGPGHHLTVQGVCVGTTSITQSLTITGIRTATSGAPVLQGDGKGRVLKVQADVVVTIKDLTIRGGNAGKGGDGGGIFNGGNLTLRDVIVTRNRAGFGGGIWVSALGFEPARLILAGKTRVSRNSAYGYGGGVHSFAPVIMKDSSQVIGNTARNGGGGVYVLDELVMLDRSRITGNSAGGTGGGGVFQDRGDPRPGVVCAPAPGANVFGNAPNDCQRWTSHRL
jgi:hypothetical protein